MWIRIRDGAKHLEALARKWKPVQAEDELAWNSPDADPHKVQGSLPLNEAEGIVSVTVEDGRHGIGIKRLTWPSNG